MQELDRKIIEKAAKGDIDCFEEIFKTYSSLVYHVAFRVSGSHEDAGDITQNVFLLLHRKLASFRFQSKFTTWVYRIASNQALNHVKSRAGKKYISYDEAFAGEVSLSAVNIRESLENNEAIDKLLSYLTPEQRICIILRTVQGLSYAEIAEAVGVDIDVVRSRLRRAREKLVDFKSEVKYGL